MPLLAQALPAGSALEGDHTALALLVGLVVVAAFGATIELLSLLRWTWSVHRRRAALSDSIETLGSDHDARAAMLEGTLELDGPACASFADGTDAVCSSLAGARSWEAGASIRAGGTVRLALRDGIVELRGPLEAAVGRVEHLPGVGWSELGRAARRRLDQSLGEAHDARPRGAVAIRTLRAGDRTIAQGAVERCGPERATDYRGPAVDWVMRPSPTAAAIILTAGAFVRRRGWLWCARIGLRPKRVIPLRLGAGLLGAVLVAGLLVLIADERPTPDAATAPAAPRRLNPAQCVSLQDRYASAREQARACRQDSDCAAELRDRYWISLDECWRFVNRRSPALARADGYAESWLAGGCAGDVEECPRAPAAICRDGLCDERPPPNLPRTWARATVLRAFSLFLPPDLPPQRVEGTDSVVRAWQRPGLSLSLDYGMWSDPLDRYADEPAVERSELHIGSYAGFLVRFRWEKLDDPEARARRPGGIVAAHFPRAPRCAPTACGFMEPDDVNLTLWADCSSADDCDTAEQILRSIQFW